MAKGAYLTPRIRELITRIYLDDRQIRPTEAHKLLLQKMKAEGLHEIFGPSFPSISTVSKELKSLRERDEARSLESKGLDQPWSLGCLANREYSIPAEALPLVMAAYQKRLSENDVLNVREALWIGRLYKLIDPSDLVTLMNWVTAYALEEWVSEITTKESFNSEELDLQMAKDIHSIPEIVKEIEIWRIAEKYGADPVKLKNLNLSIEETEQVAKSRKFRKEGKK